MNRLSTLSRLLITAVTLGALTQMTSLTYYLSVAAADSAAVNSVNLAIPEPRHDAARSALIRAIAKQFGITVADRTAEWQLDEVGSLKSSLDQITGRLSELTGRDARRLMTDLFGGIAFYRDRNWRGSIAYTIGGTVSFYDAWARYDNTGRAFYLAHELGHVLDAHDSPLHLLLGEVSQVFARDVDAYSDEDGVYHLGQTYPLRDPRDRPRHRTDSAAEDWAESFATVLVPAFEAELRDIGAAREKEVQRLIRQWAAHTLNSTSKHGR